MSAPATLDMKPGELRVFTTSQVGAQGHTFTANQDGTGTIHSLEIFRAGTFRDSWGDQATWTDAHLQQMVFHFDMLRGNGIFPDVPFRSDHSFSIEKVIGYFDALRAVGDKLVADINVTEPTAAEKFIRGTYRSRSLEVGMYVTNNEEAYYPVVMGCAFVDIPAVEGLHSRDGKSIRSFSFSSPSQEVPKVTTPVVTDVPAAPPAPAPQAHVFRIGPDNETDFAKVQVYITGLEAEVTTLRAGAAAAEDFAKGVREAEREAFVKSLATEGKIVAPQVEGLVALCKGFSPEQFEAYKATYAAAPKLPLLENHSGAAGDGSADQGLSAEAKALQDAKDMVAHHRRSGLAEADIQKTASYRLLVAAGAK